eukprot:Hpha_TRINITY_DN16033_c0_g9::TRINITY_DN16033_c0_g9_i1::g.121692::m.121692
MGSGSSAQQKPDLSSSDQTSPTNPSPVRKLFSRSSPSSPLSARRKTSPAAWSTGLEKQEKQRFAETTEIRERALKQVELGIEAPKECEYVSAEHSRAEEWLKGTPLRDLPRGLQSCFDVEMQWNSHSPGNSERRTWTGGREATGTTGALLKDEPSSPTVAASPRRPRQPGGLPPPAMPDDLFTPCFKDDSRRKQTLDFTALAQLPDAADYSDLSPQDKESYSEASHSGIQVLSPPPDYGNAPPELMPPSSGPAVGQPPGGSSPTLRCSPVLKPAPKGGQSFNMLRKAPFTASLSRTTRSDLTK